MLDKSIVARLALCRRAFIVGLNERKRFRFRVKGFVLFALDSKCGGSWLYASRQLESGNALAWMCSCGSFYNAALGALSVVTMCSHAV